MKIMLNTDNTKSLSQQNHELYQLEPSISYIVLGIVHYELSIYYLIKKSYDYSLFLSDNFIITHNIPSRYWHLVKQADIVIKGLDKLDNFRRYKGEDIGYQDPFCWNQPIMDYVDSYYEKMFLEFPDTNYPTAEAIENGWVLCGECVEAWQPFLYDGMSRCPKCNTIQNNPYYVDVSSL